MPPLVPQLSAAFVAAFSAAAELLRFAAELTSLQLPAGSVDDRIAIVTLHHPSPGIVRDDPIKHSKLNLRFCR